MTEVKYDIGGGKEIIAEYDENGIMEITRECFEMLIEKQIPKKPKKYIAFDGIERNGCPSCPRNEILYAGQKYCSVCGQKLAKIEE